MGWAPARSVAGENWLLPHLVNAVDDRYEVIGLVTYRALRQFTAGKDLSPDFLALPPERRRAALLKAMRTPGPLTPAASRLITSKGELDEAAIRRLRAARNERPVLLKE
jgi:hypothetical protein